MEVITFKEYISMCEKSRMPVVDYDVYNDNQLGVVDKGVFSGIELSEQAIRLIRDVKIQKGLRSNTPMIPVNLTFMQVRSIFESCEMEAENINFTGMIIWEVYPGRLIVRVGDYNGHSAIAWTKPINHGSDQSYKIEWALDADTYKSMIAQLEKALETLNRFDDVLYFKVREGSVKVYIENHVNSQMELVWSR